jgi:hypothetical protein
MADHSAIEWTEAIFGRPPRPGVNDGPSPATCQAAHPRQSAPAFLANRLFGRSPSISSGIPKSMTQCNVAVSTLRIYVAVLFYGFVLRVFR